jgi:anti-anti-sigma factor
MFELKVNKNTTVRITGELLINNVEEFYQKMEKLLNKGAPNTFDLSGLKAIDISNLQVLLSYKRSIPKESEFKISKASKNVKKTLKLIGFAKPLHFTR